jgi:hypothetical protein
MLMDGLAPGQPYHWRLRVLSDSPFVPRSHWLWFPYNAVTEADLRTDSDPTAVMDDSAAPVLGRLLHHAKPNPFGASTELSYTLPERGRLRLGVYDVQGRQVEQIADGIQSSGRHTARWDGRSAGRKSLPAGVYFVRLEFAGIVETRKVIHRP